MPAARRVAPDGMPADFERRRKDRLLSLRIASFLSETKAARVSAVAVARPGTAGRLGSASQRVAPHRVLV